jgi:hypothetical protein
MKKDFVTLKDCKFNLIHSEGTGLDGVVIDVRLTELSQIQRLVARLGGSITLYNCPLELSGHEPEIMTWLSYSVNGVVTLSSHLSLTIDQYKLMMAGFGGNNMVYFGKPQVLTMIDNTYFALPDDRSSIVLSYLESATSAIQIQKED